MHDSYSDRDCHHNSPPQTILTCNTECYSICDCRHHLRAREVDCVFMRAISIASVIAISNVRQLTIVMVIEVVIDFHSDHHSSRDRCSDCNVNVDKAILSGMVMVSRWIMIAIVIDITIVMSLIVTLIVVVSGASVIIAMVLSCNVNLTG